MAEESLSALLGFGAGVLTILSPCVLPLIPIVLGTAGQQHRFGPIALAAGLVVSFTSVGFVVAAFGASLGLDAEAVRTVGAYALGAAGLLLMMPQAQAVLATTAGPLVSWASERQEGLDRFGLAGQAGIGVLLGLVWSPCVGPTLGAATVVAAQGEQLSQVALVMAAFGTGIAAVMVAIAFAGRSLFARWRGRLMTTGTRGKKLLAVILIVVAAAILTGIDRWIEGVLVTASPDWLVDLSTKL